MIALLASVAAYTLVSAVLARHRPRVVRTHRPKSARRSTTQQRLDEAGAGISAGRYRLTILATVLGVAFVIYALTGTASLAVPPAVAIGLAPNIVFQRRQAKVLGERRRPTPE